MLDPDMQEFVAETQRFFAAQTAGDTVADQRRTYHTYACAFAVARPPEIESEDGLLALPDRVVPLRRYRPGGRQPQGTVLYAHGGGFILGSLDSHDTIVARIAAATGADVVAVDYRLAPEHPAPAALEDVVAAADAVLRGATPFSDLPSGPVALCGDSAGATLVAAAALRLVERATKLAALALIYPMLGRDPAPPACRDEAEAPMLTLADVRYYRDLYLAGREPDPWTFPLDAPSLDGLPPTFLLAAEHDPLRDDCPAFADRLRRAGVPAEAFIGPGLVHGFLRALDRSPVASYAFERCLDFLGQRLASSR